MTTMGKIVLLDFEEKDRERLAGEKFDVERRSTGPRSDDPGSPVLPGDCETVFYQMDRQEPDGQDQASMSDEVADIIEKGGKVICFIGKGSLFHLTNIIGVYPELHLQEANPADGMIFRPKPPYKLIFDRFQPFITHAYTLFQDAVAEPSWDMGSTSNGKFEFLAKSQDGHPFSLLIRKGKGFYLLLPWFGPKNIDVAEFILQDVFPKLDLKAGETEEYGWLDQEEYTFPVLKDLFVRRVEEKERHERALLEIEDRIREARATEQESFNKLLKGEGQDLKKSVVQALQVLGWGKVVDVDEYWKKVIRNKEEDVWLIETGDHPVEVSMQREHLILVLVKSNKSWATDDECALLQKYKGRRMQEFDNTKMKAVLIGNYFTSQEAKLRNNPFASTQCEEAQKDGNGLLTTYELFKAVKAEKEGKVRQEDIRKQLREKTGLIQFEY
jgi:hypothetical protein